MFLFFFSPSLAVLIQIPFFKMPFSIHLVSFGYSVFSPLNASYVPTCCPCFSTYCFSPSCLFFLFHSSCLKPISQIGSRGPVSQHLTWERPGRGPGWRQSQVRGVGRDSIPASAQCLWMQAALGAVGKVLGDSCTHFYCASYKCCLGLGISLPHTVNADPDTVPNILS